MAGKSKGSHGVDFAKRYGSDVGLYLSAYSAITRADALLEDARGLRSTLEAATPEEARWAPWYPADVISYYSVGYVTCLEWHARSRIRDLLTFMPDKANAKDINQIRDSAVLEMFSANVTIAGVVAGATKINSLSDYMNVFERVFEAVGIREKPFGVIKAERPETGKPWVSEEQIELLTHLHPYRHDLVHEIGIGKLGHPNVRDTWQPQDAVEHGEIVLNVMQALEAKLRTAAPWNFPNLLNEDFVPVRQHQVMMREIEKMERRIDTIVDDFTIDAERRQLWRDAKTRAADHLESELFFLEHADMLHYRYEDLRTPLMDAAVRVRFEYLKSVLEVVGGVWGIESESEPPSSDAPDGDANGA